MKQYVEAGRIVNTHGINGEVKIEVWLDSPAFFKTFKRLFINGAEKRILSAREHKQFIIARLEGVEDINAAMALKGKTVEILRADAHMKDGEFFVQDILGFTVVDEDGHTVGKLVDAFETPASMLYVVRGESEHLIPAVREFILGIDAEKEEIRVHLIEGM
ncbi:MAG: 16S rRNA processing protein RimM [Oscillospiraceae bacterium]|nr:16S rRNA processing protein RimM [Oscillospiraceae bacterium]